MGHHWSTSISNVSWNRSNSEATNFLYESAGHFTEPRHWAEWHGAECESAELRAADVQLSNIQGLNEQQPSLSVAQTISISETLSWIHGNITRALAVTIGACIGTFYRDRMRRDFYVFRSIYRGCDRQSCDGFFTGGPAAGITQMMLDSAIAKSYLRDNVFDAYAAG